MEVLEERDGYRLRLEPDIYPEEPYDEGASPLLRIELLGYAGSRARYSAKHVDHGRWPRWGIDRLVSYAAERLFSKYDKINALLILERYLRAFFGVTKVETYESQDYLYATYDPEKWRQAVGAPEGSANLDEYKAWIEGDCWGWVIEKRVTWHTDEFPGATEYAQRNTWEVVDSCSGYYGSEYAEQGAREMFAHTVEGALGGV